MQFSKSRRRMNHGDTETGRSHGEKLCAASVPPCLRGFPIFSLSRTESPYSHAAEIVAKPLYLDAAPSARIINRLTRTRCLRHVFMKDFRQLLNQVRPYAGLFA